MDEMQEILEDFLIEAFEMIEQLDQDLIKLEHNPKDLELLNRIFRVAHTIKGSSSFLNINILTNLTHNIEDVLNKARHGDLVITPNIMDIVLESIDLMKILLINIRDSGTDNGNVDITDVVKKLQAISQENKSIKKSQNTKKDKTTVSANVGQTVRVDVKRLDHLMNLIGELVLGKNRLMSIYDSIEERYNGEQFLEELNQVVSSISIITTDLQLTVMQTRMLSISKIFNKFPRIVRNLARDMDKNIDLIISGEETKLDKSIIEEIGDSLVHIIRNSCDHGIESPKERIKKGKSEVGRIELKAYNESNYIVIEITDDGKGLDPDSLKQRALEKGIINECEVGTMTDKEAFYLVFKAGFSTAKAVTNVSGRGVGMDVVKTNIEKLNGIIDIESKIDKGTALKLKIPLTVAIMQALIIKVQDEYYAIPLNSVLETIRINQDEIHLLEGKSMLRLREEILTLVRLSDIFKIDTVLKNSNKSYVVIVGIAENKIGIIVDYLIGQEEVVIKSLGYYLKGTKGIAGATIRSNGKIALIIDVASMINMARHIKVSNLQKDNTTKEKTQASDYVILVVDDSHANRMTIKHYLQPLGVTLLETTNSIEALEIIKNSDKYIDTILIDMEMPKMDGYNLVTEIRKYNKFKHLPLIAITSKNKKADKMRMAESGITEYLTKPYSAECLLNIVKRNINFNIPEHSASIR